MTDLTSTFVLLGQLMSVLSDDIAALKASVDAASTRVQATVSTLNQQIADLQQQLASGGASQADLDALAAIKATVDGLDPTNPAVLPPVGP